MNEVLVVPGLEECEHLVELLKERGIPFELSEDPGFFFENEMVSPPALIVNGRVLNYIQALNWLNHRGGAEG